MILNLNKTNVGLLLLHLNISRRNVSRGFKSKYLARKYKKYMKSYDEVLETLETAFESDKEHNILHFNIREINMIEAFLNWYTMNLDDILRKANNKNEVDHRQLQELININKQIKKLKAYAT